MKTGDIRACPVCGTALHDGSESCPVCALRGALESESVPSSAEHASSDSEFFFEHYQLLKNEDGTPIELGRGAMGVTYRLDRTPERRALGDAAVNEALRLRPNLPEAHLAAALHLISVSRDFEKARKQLVIAAQGLPNSPYVFWFRAAIDTGQGRWEEATTNLEQAAILEPRYPKLLLDLVSVNAALHRFRQAEQTADRPIELKPDEPALKILKAYLAS